MDRDRVNEPGARRGRVRRVVQKVRVTWAEVGGVQLLFLAIPAAVLLHVLGISARWQFLAAGLAIVPLAGLMGEATENLAERLGPGAGGLLNATFGNAAELIIALFALSKGLDDVVKASLIGSVMGNLLLVLGGSLLAGGLRYKVQHFNKTAAGMGGTMMAIAAVGMLVPALFHRLVEGRAPVPEHRLSLGVAVILMATYVLSLVFSLRTHRELYNPGPNPASAKPAPGEHSAHAWGLRKSAGILLGATVLVAWMSEILVGAVEETSRAIGMSEVFVGVIIVAIVGNAAEHSTAILMALKNQMDLAVGIALGSALQIALFVAPALVFASQFRRRPLDLVFSPIEIVAVVLAIILARMVSEDGESNWFEGAMLLMVYAILALAFFFLPNAAAA